MPKRKSEQHADLRSLGKEAHVTQRGIASLAQSLRDKGIPDHVSRATQYRARKDLAQTQTPYGQLMTEVEVSFTDPSKRALTIGFQNPMAYVQYQATHSEHYGNTLDAGVDQASAVPNECMENCLVPRWSGPRGWAYKA